MRRTLLTLAMFLFLAVSGQHAHAGWMFGTQDRINRLQDIKMKGPKGEDLYLGYLTSIHAFMLPYSTSDGGYVFGVRGVSDKYYKLPKEKIESMQRAGVLPNPLPVYRRGAIDYVAGYLLWPFLLFIAVVCFRARRRAPHVYSEIRPA